MFAVHHHAGERRPQYASDELCKLAVSEDGGFAEFAHVHLVKNFARGGQRLDKNSLLVADGVRDAVKIFERQRQVFGKGAVVVDDTQDGAPGAMGLEAAAAKLAYGPVTIGGAGDVDFAGDAAADPTRAFAGGGASDLGHFADELVAGSAVKIVVAAEDL